MADLSLRRITIRNWATIPHAEIEFPESGLVLVLGHNAVSEGHLDSLGAGKTNFGTALARTIVGLPDRPINKFSLKKKGNTYVKVEAQLKERPFKVEIGFKCPELSKTSEGIQFTLEGEEPFSRSHIQLTKDELAKTIRMTPSLARWTTWIDGEKLRFDDLSQRDAIDLLMTSLHQPSWTTIQKKCSGVMDYFTEELRRTELDFVKAEGDRAKLAVEVAQDKLELEKAKKSYDESYAKVQERVDEAEAQLRNYQAKLDQAKRIQGKIEKKIKAIEAENAKKFADLESKRMSIDGALRTQRETTKTKLKVHLGKQNNRINEEKPLKRPKSCPTCGRDWAMDHGHLVEMQQKVEKAKDEEEKAKQDLADSQREELNLQHQLDIVEGKLRINPATFTRRLSLRHRRVEEIADQLARESQAEVVKLERLKAPVDRSAVTAAETRLNLHSDSHKKLDTEVERLAGEVADYRSTYAVVKYWHGSFGPNGISNMVLREAIGPLNEIARRISQTLCGGMIGVHFETEREMASGEGKDELTVHVDNVLGSGDLEMSSKGERCLSNLIIAETLSELSQAHSLIGFAWYDEVVNNLPAHVRMVVLHYLMEKARKNQQLIFIVDHYPESANFADHVLLAEKTREGTSLRWT